MLRSVHFPLSRPIRSAQSETAFNRIMIIGSDTFVGTHFDIEPTMASVDVLSVE